MFAVGIVYSHHREPENPFFFHGFKPYYTGSCLFASSPCFFHKIGSFFMKETYQISTVIYDYVRLIFKAHFNMPVIFLLSCPMICKYSQTSVSQSCRNIILCAEHIAAGYRHLRSSCCKHKAKICCFCFKMYRQRYLHTFKRFCFKVFFFESPKQRHIVSHPLNLSMAGRCQPYVSYVIFFHFFSLFNILTAL